MIHFDFIQNLLTFLLFSVLGWLVEVVIHFVRQKKITNPGLLYGPWMPSFGAGGLLCLYLLVPLKTHPVLVFLLGMFIGAVAEYMAHFLEEKYLGIKTVRYPYFKGILKDRVNLKNIFLFGCLAFFFVYFVEKEAFIFIQEVQQAPIRYIATLGVGVMFVDGVTSIGAIYQMLKAQDAAKKIASGTLTGLERKKLEDWYQQLKTGNLHQAKEHHLQNANEGLSSAVPRKKRTPAKKREAVVSFARGLNFYKLFWVFLIACVLGFIVESIWCLIRHGRIESRQGMLYGPFSQVYGIAAVAMTVILSKLAKYGKRWIFVGSAALGGGVEVILSFVQEKFFGSVSWHYGKAYGGIFGGRTSLVYMLFWGVLGLIFITWIFPRLSDLIEDIPNNRGIPLTWLLVILLTIDGGLSCMAVYRWTARDAGEVATSSVWRWVDRTYPDEYMSVIYPNMVKKEK